jgi:hypothetical protein
MNEEEKKAIERCKELIKATHSCWIGLSNQKAIKTVLNILEKKDKEIQYQKEINKTEQNRHKQTEKSLKGQLQKKDKIIDLMVEEFKKIFSEGEPCDLDHEMECKKYKECKDCIKQYFERKVENGN